MARTVLFFRTFRRFTGGHLKVWHYFNHVRHAPGYVPRVIFAEGSRWDESNPWYALRDEPIRACRSLRPDLLFLAGSNWQQLGEPQTAPPAIPTINLLQHVRHARPDDRRSAYLTRRAIRICVSEEIGRAVAESGRANGPVFVIPNALDPAELPPPITPTAKPDELLVVAVKEPRLGRELAGRLAELGRRPALLEARVPRAEFLRRVNRARVTVFLPHPTEGFYLPALEGMALGTLVVCPDCVGNRSFCRPGYNAFRPAYALDELVAATEAALRAAPAERRRLIERAGATAAEHDLSRERRAFLEILANVSQLW